MISGKTVVITGGRGFIASHLCERLLAANQVVLYDNLHRDAFKDTAILSDRRVRFVEGDVLDLQRLREALAGADVVVHCAAVAGIETVVKKPIVTMQVNLLGTLNALQAAVATGVRRFVNFSTSEVYGPQVYKGSEDDLTTQGPVGPLRWTYAVSKLAAEHLTQAYSEEHGLEAVSVRPFNVYGPRQVGESAIQKFVAQAVRDEPLTISGDGTQIRAWCYIDDFVDGMLRILDRSFSKMEVFNLGNPRGTITILELAEKVIAVARSSSTIQFREQASPDVDVRVPSIAKAERLLGFQPRVGLEQGIAATVQYHRRQLQT